MAASIWHLFRENFTKAPTELKSFILFSAFVTSATLLLQVMPNALKESIIPVTGWIPAMPYTFCMIILLGPMLSRQPVKSMLHAQKGCILLLIIILIAQILQLATIPPGPADNPYLAISAYRSVWVIGMPMLWIGILLSPRIRDYFGSLYASTLPG